MDSLLSFIILFVVFVIFFFFFVMICWNDIFKENVSTEVIYLVVLLLCVVFPFGILGLLFLSIGVLQKVYENKQFEKIAQVQRKERNFLCLNCYRMISSNDLYCPYCGEEIGAKKKTELVPFVNKIEWKAKCECCGNQFDASERFCRLCGTENKFRFQE